MGHTSLEHDSSLESQGQQHQEELEPSALFLPSMISTSPTGVLGPLSSSSSLTGSSNSNSKKHRLYLPRLEQHNKSRRRYSMDEYLSRIPRVASRAQEWFEQSQRQQQFQDLDDQEPAMSLASLLSCPTTSVLNILQGEVAHASSDQADVLVSGDATTCHVVALRSTSTTSNVQDTTSNTKPLTSLAHVDAGIYDECLEAMIQEHLQHHERQKQQQQQQCQKGMQEGACGLLSSVDDNDEEDDDDDDDFGFFVMDDESDHDGAFLQEPLPEEGGFLPSPNFPETTTTTTAPPPVLVRRLSRTAMPSSSSTLKMRHHQCEPIHMELHIVGGYLDKDGTSQELSNSLMTSFSRLANKYQDQMHMSLSTAAMSSLNTDFGTEVLGPKSRGLAIDTRTGQVWPVQSSLPEQLQGPGLEVRSARASFVAERERLAVIHHSQSNGCLQVEPFSYQQNPLLNVLLQVPDDVLLQHTSTSPEHESPDFCQSFRRTLSFVNTVPSESVFGQDCRQPVCYVRSSPRGNPNEWKQIQ